MPDFDLPKGRAGRDEGMERVTRHSDDFKDQFAAYIDRLPRGWIGTCEDIRKVWPLPHPHPNAWGACWNAAKRRGQLVQMPQQVQMTSVKSHARKTHLHRRA